MYGSSTDERVSSVYRTANRIRQVSGASNDYGLVYDLLITDGMGIECVYFQAAGRTSEGQGVIGERPTIQSIETTVILG